MYLIVLCMYEFANLTEKLFDCHYYCNFAAFVSICKQGVYFCNG